RPHLPAAAVDARRRLHDRLLHLLAGDRVVQPLHLDPAAALQPVQRTQARAVAVAKGIDIDLLDSGGDSLYVSERKVYPRDVSGRFDRLRRLAVFWLLGMYYLFPWLRWDGR